MKRWLFLGSILSLAGLLLWFVFLRSECLELEVRFTYSRTMEHRTVRERQARMRLREKSCQALRLLFGDWAWNSRVGEKPFCEIVKTRLVESLRDEDRRFCQKEVDDLIRGVRFAIIEGPKEEIPVMGKVTIGPGSPSVVKALAESLKECMSQYVVKENENWAEKATMNLGIEFQRRKRALVTLKNEYSKTGSDAEKTMLKRKIEDGELLVANALEEWERGMKIYRERMDASIAFP